jgi:outer membrane receptor for ferrienterochelin and colicin
VIVERRQQRLEMAGFYQRQRLGFGSFITRDKIAASPAISLTDLLRRYPGVQVVIDPNSLETDVILRGTARLDRCYPSVAIDGMVVRMGGIAKLLLSQSLPPSEQAEVEKAGDSIDVGLDTLAPPPEEIEAIELYPSLAGLPPFLVGTTSPCGAVVIWTRR